MTLKTTANNSLFKSFDWRWTGNQFEGEFTMDAEGEFIDLLEQHIINRWEFDLGGMVGKVWITELQVVNLPVFTGFGSPAKAYTQPTAREVRVRFIRVGDVELNHLPPP